MTPSAPRKKSSAEIDAAVAAATTFFTRIVKEGDYDSLVTDAVDAREMLRYSETTREHADAVSAWLNTVTLPAVATWCLGGDAGMQRTATLFERFAIAFELDAMRPGLLAVSPLSRSPTELGIGEDVITTYVRRGPGATNEERDHCSHIFLCAIWRTVAPYRIFEANDALLARIDGELNRIAADMATLRDQWFVQWPLSLKPPFQGVLALLSLERGRISRAIGGAAITQASIRLTEALRIYQQRVGGRAKKRRDEGLVGEAYHKALEGDLRFSSFRSARAQVQLAYLDVLRAAATNAEARLETASMLALTTSDNLLQSEISLVSLTARRLRMQTSAGTNDAYTELASVRQELDDLQLLEHKRKRFVYADMARFQHALTYLYAWPATATPMEGAQKAVDISGDLGSPTLSAHGPVARHFWQSSGLLLQTRAWLTAARAVGSTTHEGKTALSKASNALAAAKELIGTHHAEGDAGIRHLGNLEADCQLYAAWIAVEERKYPGAEKILNKIPPDPVTAGYTTLPASAAFVELLRIAVDLGMNRWFLGRQRLESFAAEHRPTLEVGWLLDFHDALIRREAGQHIVHDVTEAAVAEEYRRVLKGEPMPDGRRHYTMDAIRDQLFRWLYPVTERVVREHTGIADDIPTIEELMLLWDVSRPEVMKKRKERFFEGRHHGARRSKTSSTDPDETSQK